jgi:ribosomal protein S27AE
MNKYTRWYKQLIANAQNRITEGYTERHHIHPRSLGGADTPDNLVELTAREHFVCHWLLTKMTAGEDRYKMLNALRMMRAEKEGQQRYNTAITSRVYESIKKEYAQLQSERFSGENNPMYGDKFYRSKEGKQKQKIAITGDNNGAKKEESRLKISQSKLGKKREAFSEEWRAKMAEKKKGENNPRYGATVSEETKEKMRAKALGRKQSEETVRKKAEAVRGSKREKKLCPHCGQMIAVNTYSRWHGPNCGQIKTPTR